VEATNISRRALIDALLDGRLTGRQISPKLWLIDVDDPSFDTFLDDHEKWLSVRKRKDPIFEEFLKQHREEKSKG
jgi:hypothetical protein